MTNGPDHTSDSMEINSPEKGQRSPAIRDFNALFADIRNFNSQFSLGPMMFNVIARTGVIGQQEESLPLNEEAQVLTASGISMIHAGVLSRVGLELEPVSGKKATIMGLGEKTGTGEMRINLKDDAKFLSFLRSINPQECNSTEIGGNLESLSNILVQQIVDHYNLQEPSDEALNLLGGLGDIVSEYKRLRINAAEKLEALLAHSRKGDLLEHLTVQQEGLLSEPGKNFGPADWQKDASPKFLADRWDRALKVLKMTRDNRKAQDLYGMLFEHLDRSLNIALQNLETLVYYSEEQKMELREVLLGVRESFG